MKDKVKLKKLVDIIGSLIKIEGNEWLIDEVLRIIGEVSSIEEISKHNVINDIYEYCIKKIIAKQAEDFYRNFPVIDEELISTLKYDYIEMEYNRRRDRFYEFSFCMNQQIEGMTNYLFENKSWDIWYKLDSKIKNKIVENYEFEGKRIKNTLQQVINKKNEQKGNWSDLSKFKLVYYLMNNSRNHNLPFDFKRKRDLRKEISIARNESHRGSSKYEWQEEILSAIEGNEAKYYFRFYGFLEEFVSQIESSYGNTKTINKKNKKRNKPEKRTNTIEENVPELAKLREQLKKNK